MRFRYLAMNLPDPSRFAPYGEDLIDNGFCVVPGLLSAAECQAFVGQYDNEAQYRSTIDMARYNFGSGQYRYFDAPLPEQVQELRKRFYELLVGPASVWAERARIAIEFPATFAEYEAAQHNRRQTRPTPLILRYRPGDYNCLHQDISGEQFFPYQMIIVLNQQGEDFNGGDLVLTQQRPRMQTVPYVLKPTQGDCVIFASKYHPCRGQRGYYRTKFRHGVAALTAGERYSLGIIFHNFAAPSVAS